MSSNTVAMVPIFNGSDYRVWAQKMEDYLKSLKLWRFVTGTTTRPTPVLPAAPTLVEQQAMNDWDDLNDQAQGIIALRLSGNLRTHIAPLASVTWTSLSNTFGTPG